MTRGSSASVAGLGLGLAVLLVLIVGPPFRPSDGDGGIIPVAPPVRQALSQAGTARVLVELRLPGGAHVAEEALPSAAAAMTQRADIAQAQFRVLARIAGKQHRLIHKYQTVPFLALEIDPAALAELEAASLHVTRVHEDALSSPGLAQSVPLVEGDQAWARGFDGTGIVIAILDTGVDTSHPFLAGKVVEEACFSSGASLCPNGQTQQIGPGAGRNCPLSVNGCDHGTHVSGIAAGNGAGAGVAFSGVAKGARIIAVQVFSRFDNPVDCGGGPTPCVLAYTSDMIMGLDHVYSLRAAYNLASVNISIGGGESSTFCDSDPRKPSIDNLRAARIATVISAGNAGLKTAVSKPACISSAVSVGATTKSDAVADFSNVASFMSLFAPGASITSSVPGGAFAVFNGTSMAAPHAAGAWAILRQAAPGATVLEILSALQDTGRLVTDTRSGGSVTRPRIQIAAALNRFAAQTASLAVVRAGAGSGTVTSSPAGITCGATCSASYAVGTAVTLTASPAAGSVFGGWGGGCSGAGTCTVTVTATTTVTATFDVGTVGTTVIFQDGIEGDTAAWSPQAPWGVTTAAAHSGSRSWTDSPGGNYADNANVSLVSPTFDLSGFSSVTLTFWHRYDLESNFDFGNVFVTADSGTSFTKLTGFTGTSLAWSQVSLDLSAFAGSPRVQVVFQLLSDVSIARDGWYIDDVVVSGVRVTSALPGDNRAAPIPITGEAFTDTRSTQSYTSAVDDPVHSCTGLQDGRTLWYLFTPSRAGTATIQTRGSTYDTVLSAYDASTLTEVPGGCHDDVNLLALDRTSLLHVSMSAGKTYLIEVSAYGGSDGGTLAFSFSLLPQSPAGDDRAAPIVITTETFSDTRQTNGHTADASDPVHSCTGRRDGHTVWYRFTPARAGVATISTRGSDYDTVLSVHGAATLAEVPGGCHDDAADIDLTSVVQVALLAGTPYLIEVSAYEGSPGGNLSLTLTFSATGVSLTGLAAAVLPSSRSVQVGTSVTAFATLINAGAATATGCRLAPLTSLPASFTFRTTNPATNQVTGTPDTPVDVPGGGTQSFVFAFTPTAPIAPTEVRLSFDCANSDPAPITPGLNTLLLSASTTPVPDIVALAATVANDGIVNIPGAAGTGVFSVATVNLGAGGPITVSVDTGSASLPVSLSLCRTNPTTGACLAPPGSSVTTQIDAGATPTFGVFATGSGAIPFAPATNRIFVRFKDVGAVPRGATSVAVRTLTAPR